MSKYLSGTLGEQMNNNFEYTLQQQRRKQAALPIKQIKKINSQKYSNPAYNIEQSTYQTYDERASLAQTQSNQKYKKRNNHVIQRFQNQNNQRKTKQNRRKWGNFLVIVDKQSYSLTLGPDYWCFIPTFICFTAISIAVIMLVFNNTTSFIAKLSSILVCGGQIIAYALIATSNPGIARNQQEQNQDNFQQIINSKGYQPSKFCKICQFMVPKTSYHCRDCDICILEYDHHCPWTSKCIGKNNLVRFYFFLIMTPVFLVYIFISFIIIMGNETNVMRVHNIRKLFDQNLFF